MGNLSDALNVEHVVYSEETIKKRITELGAQIAKDYEGQELSWYWKAPGADKYAPVPANRLYYK